MAHVGLLLSGGVGVFLLCVGAASASLVWLAGASSISVIVGVVLASELWTLVMWAMFASVTSSIWQLPRVVCRVHVGAFRAIGAYVLRGFRPAFPEWTFRFEIGLAALRTVRVGVFAQNLMRPQNARYITRVSEWTGTWDGERACRKHGTTIEIIQWNGQEHVWIRDHARPENGQSHKERYVVLFYHPGGFVLLSPHGFVEFMNRVRSAVMKIIHEEHPEMMNVSIECFLANYRKSPEFQHPVAQEDALKMYEYMLQEEKLDPARVVLMGHSSGGGLCASTMLRLKAKGSRMPCGAVLAAPFVGYDKDEKLDDSHCMVTIDLGLAMLNAFHPTPFDRASYGDAAAVDCDLSGLPPALIQVGSLDTTYPTILRFYKKAQADGLGASWELDVWKNMPHAFLTLPDTMLPDTKRAVQRIAMFIAQRFADTTV